jgi:hypothetical protein
MNLIKHRGNYLFPLMNDRPMSFCLHELPLRPKESIKLPFLHTLSSSVRNPVNLDGICYFFSVNFDLKTKIPSTVINKKNIKKKKKPEGKGVAAATPEVSGWLASHPGLRGGRTVSPEPGVAGATFRGGSRASHDLWGGRAATLEKT